MAAKYIRYHLIKEMQIKIVKMHHYVTNIMLKINNYRHK